MKSIDYNFDFKLDSQTFVSPYNSQLISSVILPIDYSEYYKAFRKDSIETKKLNSRLKIPLKKKKCKQQSYRRNGHTSHTK